jgi:phospholipase C
MRVDRRQVLAGLGASLGAALVGCGGERGDAGDSGDDASPDGPVPNACTRTGSSSEELLSRIDTIVVLCMENRSFDHYLGSLRLREGRTDIDGLVGGESNPAPGGSAVASHLLETFTPADPPHDWEAAHAQWHDGANDGFVIAHAGADQADVKGYYTRAENRWFSSTLGPTWPNRYYLHAASSKGQKSNAPVTGLSTIWQRLDAAQITNRNYYHDVAWATGGLGKFSGLAKIERFFADAAAGNLPAFSIVDPAFFGGGANDDHPAHDVRMGQALIGSVVAAVGASPQWKSSLIVITYDEHGGFYDHVAPPAPPDGSEPDPAWRRLGFRVPSLVIGPRVRRGCAIDTVLEHSSVIATATKRWKLEPVNPRATLAADLSTCLDPALLDDPQPPPTLPPIVMSRRALAARQARLRGHVAHHELDAAIAGIDPALDRRGDTDAIVSRVLGWGERLGVVELAD